MVVREQFVRFGTQSGLKEGRRGGGCDVIRAATSTREGHAERVVVPKGWCVVRCVRVQSGLSTKAKMINTRVPRADGRVPRLCAA